MCFRRDKFKNESYGKTTRFQKGILRKRRRVGRNDGGDNCLCF